jgi:hypothetical protein
MNQVFSYIVSRQLLSYYTVKRASSARQTATGPEQILIQSTPFESISYRTI